MKNISNIKCRYSESIPLCIIKYYCFNKIIYFFQKRSIKKVRKACLHIQSKLSKRHLSIFCNDYKNYSALIERKEAQEKNKYDLIMILINGN